MMLLPRPVPGLLVALALATCALASTSAAQSTGSDEQHVVVAQPPGTSLRSALAVRHLTPDDLKLRKTTQDSGGRRHHRYRQTFNGLDVIGGDLVVHADAQGSIYAINGAARGNLPASLGQHDIGPSAALTFVQADARFAGMSMSTPRRRLSHHSRRCDVQDLRDRRRRRARSRRRCATRCTSMWTAGLSSACIRKSILD